MSDPTTTPMMSQYRRIRNQLPPETILFFRLGDFYEMFFDDAKVASQILDIALTRRQGVPMCGIPFHASDAYLARLIRAGKKVAICDQMEDPSATKGIVRREVTAIVTPGTATEEAVLDSKRPNYLAAVMECDGLFGLAMLDLSTGDFWVEESRDAGAMEDNLGRFAPRECLVPTEARDTPALRALLAGAPRTLVTACDDWTFRYDAARDELVRHFKVHSLEGFGCESRPALVGAAGAVLHYVREELHRAVAHVRSLRVNNPSDFMILDEATCANLDLVGTRGNERASTSLIGVLDVTRTPMGGRLLREWCLRPLAERTAIVRRHEAVSAWIERRAALQELREALSGIRDLERLIARLAAGGGNGRDVRALGTSLACLPAVQAALTAVPNPLLTEWAERIQPLPELVALIDKTLVDEPPMTIREGGVIRKGYHAELDEWRELASAGRNWLAEYQIREQARTGINTLKVRHNKVFGYYIEISRGQATQAPADYTRKQTLVNAERFITPELKDYENRILVAQERSIALEYNLFIEIRDQVTAHTAAIQATAQAVAAIDVLSSFADRAIALRYVRPVMTDGDELTIREGRHPVVEQMPEAERFVANDTQLDGDAARLVILTGPNMAGKSTYIRQVALIAILAHIGSFVPARETVMGVIDRVFTRVGASDDLARGRSTFMVEMQETANILNNATGRSLIVLDEIGRGTSTFDGISIAWAVAEYLHDRVKAKTLFATHYHELTDLALTLRGVKNYNVLVREVDDRVVFLRRIVPGGADKSYGIQVARLAGLPVEVIDRSKEILANLEEGELGESGQPKLARRNTRKLKIDPRQLDLFGG
jgi:DNA mismatch repair protein MutS